MGSAAQERLFIVGFDSTLVDITKGNRYPKWAETRLYLPRAKDNHKESGCQSHSWSGTWIRCKDTRHIMLNKETGLAMEFTFPIKKGAVTRTISARYHKGRNEILVSKKDRPRRLTASERCSFRDTTRTNSFSPSPTHKPTNKSATASLFQPWRSAPNS